MRVGVLFVGIQGASASTFVGGYMRERSTNPSFRLGSYWCAVAGDFPRSVYDLVLGGWDYRFSDLKEAISANRILTNNPLGKESVEVFDAILGPSDYGVRVEGRGPTHSSAPQAVEAIRSNIATFRSNHALDKVIVINSSSPAYCSPDNGQLDWSSNSAYALATILEGADWVEFTPSESITPELIELAKTSRSRLAGRDGSTGQTILKLCLRDFFHSRGIRIDSWYSTNLIGNRDGLVLSNSDYNRTKLRDKLGVLPAREGESTNHIVEIQYIPPAGDDKEAWDCVHISSWLDSHMSVRLNWQGKDSFLAAALMLDIISGLIHAEAISAPYGLMAALGVFFKNPIGHTTYTFEDLINSFRNFVRSTADSSG